MAARPTSVHIPQPCPESWAAMTPRGPGRHCATCQRTVVDFTRMSEAEVVAYLAVRQGQRVCGIMLAPVVTTRYRSNVRGPLRWLLAAAAFLGWQAAPALSLPPQQPPRESSFLKPLAKQKMIIIRGVVIDDAFNIPATGILIFINDTKYGTVTDQKGAFTLSFPVDWEPAKSGAISLDVKGDAFELLGQQVAVHFEHKTSPGPITIRLRSQPERGRIMGKAYGPELPIAPPNSRKGRH